MFKRYWWMLLVMAPVGMMAGLMLAAVVTYVMPKKYESFSVIEIKPRERAIDDHATPALSIGTELSIIKSSNLLSKVIDSLDLLNRWVVERDTALKILSEIVEADSIGGTDLVDIRVRHTNREDARDIVAEVARAYKKSRDEQQSELMKKWILEVREAVREQEDKVDERRMAVTILGSSKTRGMRNDPVDEQNYTTARRDFEMELALLESMKLKLITEEIKQNLPNETVVIHDDPVIADSPISPNVTLNLVAGTFGGLLLSPFLALPLMWSMNRRSSHVIQTAGGF